MFAGRVLRHCYAGDASLPHRQKGHYSDNTKHWPNADVINAGPPSATLGTHYSNQNHLGSNQEYREYIFFEHFLNTQVINPATSNVIFDLFIRTVSQKYQPFPIHSTPLSSKQNTHATLSYLWVSQSPTELLRGVTHIQHQGSLSSVTSPSANGQPAIHKSGTAVR